MLSIGFASDKNYKTTKQKMSKSKLLWTRLMGALGIWMQLEIEHNTSQSNSKHLAVMVGFQV
jgi:hypothetical protein